MFFIVAERTPPLLHSFYQVEKVGKERNRQWAVKLTIENPKQLGFGYVS